MLLRRSILVAIGLSACSSTGTTVLVDDTSAVRGPDGRVVVDVHVTGVEHGGDAVGNYCVGVHWFNPGVDLSLTKVAAGYFGEIDFAEQCASDLTDGDQRVFRIVSPRTDLPPGAVYRAQARVGGAFENKDGVSP